MTKGTKIPIVVDTASLAYSEKKHLCFNFECFEPQGCSVRVQLDGNPVSLDSSKSGFQQGSHLFDVPLALEPTCSVIITFLTCEQEDPVLVMTCKLSVRRNLIVVSREAVVEDGRRVFLEDVYGIGNRGECVICLSEISDTTVLPCRHMCVCQECASFLLSQPPLDRKCPVCRANVGSLMHIEGQAV